MLLDFARLQGYDDQNLRKLEDVLARAKDVDDAITEFRRLRTDSDSTDPRNSRNAAGGKYTVVKGENELIRRLDDGWSLIQNLRDDKFLIRDQ
jgi:hypothetical protein